VREVGNGRVAQGDEVASFLSGHRVLNALAVPDGAAASFFDCGRVLLVSAVLARGRKSVGTIGESEDSGKESHTFY